jgi:hypothetical protein
MATTTNYGWTTPDDTALVKDGAAAIRTLGSSVDTTTKNLNPETTLGDIAYRSSTANVKTRLGLGTAGQVLQVNSGATAPEWATFSAGGMTLLASGSIAASATGVDITSISASYKDLVLYLTDWSGDATAQTAGTGLQLRFNNDSASNYNYTATTTDSSTIQRSTGSAGIIFANVESTANDWAAVITINNYADTTSYKLLRYNSVLLTTSARNGGGAWFGTPAAIDRVTVVLGTGAFDNGTYQLYGVK